MKRKVDHNEDIIQSGTFDNPQIERYRLEVITDETGTFVYDENPSEYLKARKRMQNRESAVRSRMRKKNHISSVKD